MRGPRAMMGFMVGMAVAVVGCAFPGGPGQGRGTGDAPQQTSARKSISIGFSGDPPALASRIAAGGAGGTGVSQLEYLVNRGLTIADAQNVRHAQLAEAVPTTENGLWKVFPDGRMETTWKIRGDARWHDGTPFTSADLLFSSRVDQDKDLPFRLDAAYKSIETIEAPDPRTLTVQWKAPYIYADGLFGDAVPLPRHLLERPYEEDKATFVSLPYWGDEYVGTGPYRLQQWARGSHIVVQASDDFVLGRPKIDTIEVKFIPDFNTLIANVLAGTVLMTFAGSALSIDQAIQARDSWADGRVEAPVDRWIVAFPQLLTPDPALLGDVRLRRALLHALDRQQMADTIQQGLTGVAHMPVSPEAREYREIERSVVRYEYDPRKATQMIEELGYRKGSDGLFRDAQNRSLVIETRARSTGDANGKAMLAASDSWQRLGVDVQVNVVPEQLYRDPEYRANFPALNVQGQPTDLDNLVRYHSSEVPLAENRYRGESKNRYMNPDLDALIDRFYATIPRQERTQALGQIVQHITNQVIALGLVYDASPKLFSNRLVDASGDSPGVNVHQWDLRN